jgi:hypothetical protein
MILSGCSPSARATPGGWAGAFLLAGVTPVGLLALRGRQAGVVRGLRSGSKLGLQFGDAGAQSADLPRLHFDPRMLGQHQGDQVIAGEVDASP